MMTDQKFTPGPWTTYFSPALGSGRYVVNTEGDTDIAIIVELAEEGEANARLIAKAPELADVLKAMMKRSYNPPELRKQAFDILKEIDNG